MRIYRARYESGSLYVGYLPFGNFKHDAVIIFFVLSGLVICATATRPGETWITYLTARASRIYSVAIPAVALSFGLQAIAAFLEPGHSQPEPSADVFLPLSALLFILQSWHPQALPWNGPYWSLCYEVWYYIIFGILLFVRNPGRRNAVAACAALIAGPAILLLFPIWLMGVWIVQRPRFSLGPKSINFIIFFRHVWRGRNTGPFGHRDQTGAAHDPRADQRPRVRAGQQMARSQRRGPCRLLERRRLRLYVKT